MSSLYPIIEDEIIPIYKNLYALHTKETIYNYEDYIYDIKKRNKYVKSRNKLCIKAREKFNIDRKYNSSYYPTQNLTQRAIDLWNNKTSIKIPNYCCNRTNCPHIEFIKIILDILRIESNI